MTNPAMTLGAARADYYRVNGFGDDGGDSLEWVPVKILGITLKIPNTDGRRKAVKIQDLNDVVTGYQTDLRGEAEIGAWELASNCLSSRAATVLNLGALSIGLVMAPGRMARAWSLGRHTKNLYSEDGVDHLPSPRRRGAGDARPRCTPPARAAARCGRGVRARPANPRADGESARRPRTADPRVGLETDHYWAELSMP